MDDLTLYSKEYALIRLFGLINMLNDSPAKAAFIKELEMINDYIAELEECKLKYDEN